MEIWMLINKALYLLKQTDKKVWYIYSQTHKTVNVDIYFKNVLLSQSRASF